MLGLDGTLICIDRDPVAGERFERFADEVTCKTRFIGADFAEGLRTLHGEGVNPDMIYMDLGMSSMQVDAWERGFSYSYDAPLDMRMDSRQEFSAADLVNEWPESRIAQVLRRFGEERFAGGIAREIVRRRPLQTTSELVDAVKAGMPAKARFGGGHPAKRSFQAIRIAVNGELDSLDGRAADRLGHAADRRPPRRDLLPLARGPPGQAVPRRARPWLRLPAGAAGLRLRPPARSRPAHPPRGLSGPGGDRLQRPRQVRPPARRGEDRGGGLMEAATVAGRAAAPAHAPRPAPKRVPRDRPQPGRKPRSRTQPARKPASRPARKAAAAARPPGRAGRPRPGHARRPRASRARARPLPAPRPHRLPPDPDRGRHRDRRPPVPRLDR